MKLLTAKQIKSADDYAVRKAGIPGILLMENAGIGVTEACLGLFNGRIKGKAVWVFCGKGNNGGDGFVCARHLKGMGARPSVFLVGESKDLRGDALTNYRIYKQTGADVTEISGSDQLRRMSKSAAKPDLIVDALLGTGLSGSVKGIYTQIIDYINASRAKIISVDIPSGLDADKGIPLGRAVRADITVTFGYAKIGLLAPDAADYVGDLFIKDIGLPKDMPLDGCPELVEPKFVKSLFSARKYSGHKGTYGHVLVVAGSREKSGAAKLAAVSALRGGAGLVTLAVPQSAHDMIKSSLFNVMSVPLPDDGRGNITLKGAKKVIDYAQDMEVVALGPGLNKGGELARTIKDLCEKTEVPLIIDADGLNSLAPSIKNFRCTRPKVVFTPHPGEMSRLTGLPVAELQRDRIGAAKGFAKKHGVTVVLKGFRSVIAFPDSSVFINPTGNPAMAAAGMGDVLTGLLASYLSQQSDFKRGVLSAVFNHGLLGDLVAAEIGERGVLATDLVNKLSVINKTLYPAKKLIKIEEI